MTRGAAALDLAIAVILFVGMMVAPPFRWIIEWVANHFPEYGILWSNVIIGLVTVAIVACILQVRKQRPASVGLGRFRTGTLMGAALAVPGCYLAMFAVGILYSFYLVLFTNSNFDAVIEGKRELMAVIPDFSLTTMLLFGVLTGFHEELLFRGLLLTRFNAIVRNRWLAVVICATLFGAVHAYQGTMGIMQTATIGLVLGIITTRTRSLWPAIIGHAVFNSMQLAMLPLLKPLFDQLTSGPPSMP